MRLYCVPPPCNNGRLNEASKLVCHELANSWAAWPVPVRPGNTDECCSVSSSCCCGTPNVVPSAAVLVTPLVQVPVSLRQDGREEAAERRRRLQRPVLRPAVLFPEHARVELRVEFRERRLRTGALERRADRQARHGFGERRIVRRGDGDRADERPRDRFRRERARTRAPSCRMTWLLQSVIRTASSSERSHIS